ncbi:MAG TPA: glutaredoxin family protein [Vicinamibacterales bacterium]|nr:glutaredoxin family protein [Vicinamibacterales bacterium]
MVKEFLSREGYAFDAKNIEDDDSAYDELMALGARAVPTIVIGSQVVTGFDQTRLRAALAAAAGGS